MGSVKIIGIVLAFVLVGCGPPEFDRDFKSVEIRDCTKIDPIILADKIIACAKAANPMSDEEGEDLVKECRYTMKDVLCHRISGYRYVPANEAWSVEVKCTSKKVHPQAQKFCE